MAMSYDDEVGYSTSYVVGSLPRDFGYGEDATVGDADSHFANSSSSDQKPKILLMGLRRSGKSSIQKVVFHKMSPNETLFLESTNKITKDDISSSSFIQFQIWDFPGQIDFFDPAFDLESVFSQQCEALIFVIDAQDDYIDALEKLHMTVVKAYRANPNINFEVFIHKVDGLSDDHKIDTQRDIQRRANDNLADEELEEMRLSFHLTSIYDHSIFEALSKVVQKLIPQLPTLENLLNIFIASSGIEKAFLFDVVSKIYVATDSSPVDMSSYELCCDFIDMGVDISCIYGMPRSEDEPPTAGTNAPYEPAGAFDEHFCSVIKLNNGTVLYLREVNHYFALVCLLREESFQQQGIIDYNFHCLRKAVQDTLTVKQRQQQQQQQQMLQQSGGLSKARSVSHQQQPRLSTISSTSGVNNVVTGEVSDNSHLNHEEEHAARLAVIN